MAVAAADPRLTERCVGALRVFVARAGGRHAEASRDGRLVAAFDDPVRAVHCIMRARAEISATAYKLAHEGLITLTAGVARETEAGAEAERLRRLAAEGEILASPEVAAAVRGRLDVELVELDGRLTEHGERLAAVALVPTHVGRLFRYMPWTTPGRRRAGLLIVVVLVLIVVVGLMLGEPPQPARIAPS